MGAESGHTAGVTVAVPHRYTHDAAHGHTSFMIYRKKERERERGTLTAVDYTLGITKSRKLLWVHCSPGSNLIQPSLGPH